MQTLQVFLYFKIQCTAKRKKIKVYLCLQILTSSNESSNQMSKQTLEIRLWLNAEKWPS